VAGPAELDQLQLECREGREGAAEARPDEGPQQRSACRQMRGRRQQDAQHGGAGEVRRERRPRPARAVADGQLQGEPVPGDSPRGASQCDGDDEPDVDVDRCSGRACIHEASL
jgi:hypothetical protein